jgi:hypothetical protein
MKSADEAGAVIVVLEGDFVGGSPPNADASAPVALGGGLAPAVLEPPEMAADIEPAPDPRRLR